MKKICVGLIGFGTIGSGVVKVLKERRAALRTLAGVDIVLKYVCDKDLSSDRGVKVDRKILTRDVNKVLKDPDVDIVIELVGGIHPAKEFILAALKNGKHVVTANKALLAQDGDEIFRAAKKYDRQIRFEASVGGGIPIIKALREGLAANKIEAIYGIINGTSNYILSRMSDEGCDFRTALKAAQKMGVAEANPALDLNGTDSLHKLVILAGLSFGALPRIGQAHREGILHVKACDIKYAKEMGYAVKLLAIAKKAGGEVELRVHPTLVPQKHLLADIKGVYNAIYVKGDLIGENLFYGEGAGKFPTASAVISDIIDLAGEITNYKLEITNKLQIIPYQRDPVIGTNYKLKVRKIGEVKSRYYIRVSALDKPGVLAKIAGILGKHNISIASVHQKEERRQASVPVVMVTHLALEADMEKALLEIDRLPAIDKKSVAIRMESL
jgi:homoserine dehydrogenase